MRFAEITCPSSTKCLLFLKGTGQRLLFDWLGLSFIGWYHWIVPALEVVLFLHRRVVLDHPVFGLPMHLQPMVLQP